MTVSTPSCLASWYEEVSRLFPQKAGAVWIRKVKQVCSGRVGVVKSFDKASGRQTLRSSD